MNKTAVLKQRIRFLIIAFMLALVTAGLTAIPLQWEIGLLNQWLESNSFVQQVWPSLTEWIGHVNDGVQNGYGQYPFLAYGTDWLAFGHIAIAVAFIGPLRDPVKNLWVIEFGMIACVLVIPWALILGSMRGIPTFWMVVDMSFGVVGIIPLWFIRSNALKLAEEP